MKPQYEDVLVNGTEGQIDSFANGNDASVFRIDWQAQGEATITSVIQRIPDAGLSYELTAGQQDLNVAFKNRTACISLTQSLKDRFITLDGVNEILMPDYEMRAFTVSFQSDSTSIYIKPGSWWDTMDAHFPERMELVFTKTEDILAMQEGRAPKAKKAKPALSKTPKPTVLVEESSESQAGLASEPNKSSSARRTDPKSAQESAPQRAKSPLQFKLPQLKSSLIGPVAVFAGAFVLVALLTFGVTAFAVGHKPGFLLIPAFCLGAGFFGWKKKLF